MSPRGFWCKHFALKSWYSKHWKHLGAYKKCRSWVPPKIHWIRIYIFSRYLGHSRVYWSVYRKGPTWLILISYSISIPKNPQNTLTYFITSLISLMVHCLNQERPIIATWKISSGRTFFKLNLAEPQVSVLQGHLGVRIVWGGLDWAGLWATNSTSNRAALLWSVLELGLQFDFLWKGAFAALFFQLSSWSIVPIHAIGIFPMLLKRWAQRLNLALFF